MVGVVTALDNWQEWLVVLLLVLLSVGLLTNGPSSVMRNACESVGLNACKNVGLNVSEKSILIVCHSVPSVLLTTVVAMIPKAVATIELSSNKCGFGKIGARRR